MTYDFFAESNGVVIGRRQGYGKGYDVGFDDAHQQWLKRQASADATIQALRDDNEALIKTIKEANYALNSLSLITLVTMDALRDAPQSRITELALQYADMSKTWKANGYLRELPANEPVLQELAPRTVAIMKKWWEQSLDAAQKAKGQKDTNSDPIP